MGKPLITEKRWTVDLERRIQENYYSDVDHYRSHYNLNTNTDREVFVIDTPPPYPSGTWHIGAVAHYGMIDVLARTQRLIGKEVFFPWATDRNGINIEFTVEKKTKRKMKTYDRAEFIGLCHEEISRYSEDMKRIAKRIGLSCDYDNGYETDSPTYRAITQSVFLDLFKAGAVVEDLRPNLYDPVEGTTIAEAEVKRVERETKLVDVSWDVLTDEGFPSGEEVSISTTRPELICACGIVIVHPDDERYSHLIGKKMAVPMTDRAVEVRSHSSVKMEFGSGVLMVCSFGDTNDVAVFREFGLDPFLAIDLEGKMTNVAGPLEGMSVNEAREKSIEFLSAEGRITSIQERMQEVPVSERGENQIEIILLKEWYVRQTHIQERMREHISKMRFVPERNRQYLLDWMENISIDWPISRRRWYHTEVPIWYSEDNTKVIIPPQGHYVQPWFEEPPEGSLVLDRESREELGEFSQMKNELGKLTGEEKVFDTWMDSSNSGLYVAGFKQDDALFKKGFPTALRPQGKEIVRTWLYYTTLKSVLLLDSPPFQNVWVDGLGMDPWGRKMSKSLGNGIDADSVIECGYQGKTGKWDLKGPGGKRVVLKANKIGSECFRFWKACDAQVGDDFQINPEEIELRYFGVLTKLFNVARFASQFEVPADLSTPPTLEPEDRWILAEFSTLSNRTETAYRELDIYSAAQALKGFGTGVFPSHWLEMSKSRLYSDDVAANWTLHRIVKDYLVMLSPIVPFFTHHLANTLYQTAPGEVRDYPEIPITELADGSQENKRLRSLTEEVMEFNSAVWKQKKEDGVALNKPIQGINIPEPLGEFSTAFTRMHSLE